jgi:hypothetical protein
MYRLQDRIHPSRQYWYEYKIFHDRSLSVPKSHRIVLNSYSLPEVEINGYKVKSLAVVVNSNLGVEGIGAKDVYGGPNLKQFTFTRDVDGNWVLPAGNLLSYPTASMNFSFRLRYQDALGKFIDFPTSPKKQWELSITIV